MVKLLNNLNALSQPVSVSLDGVLGTITDGSNGTLTIGAESLKVIEGAGTQIIRANRGTSPIVHAVKDTVTYTAPTTTIPHARIGTAAPTGAPTANENGLAIDTTASTGGVYAWNGSAWVKAGP